MTRAQELQSELRALLAPHGLLPFGWFAAEDGQPAMLIGNIGSSLWPAFQASDEYNDGKADVLDRWTTAVLTPIAKELRAEARFPFGADIWPFQQYAKSATGMQQSPIGLLIHPEYGLWTAFRGVLIFNEVFDFATKLADWHPCDRCIEKPCLSTCPINAFTADGYDYMACRAHVRSDAGYACRTAGCKARLSCPVGQEFAYDESHQAFHMAAYI